MKLKKVINQGNPRWRVSAYVMGERRQRFFKTRNDARQWMATLEADSNCDGFWTRRTPAERLEIMEAFVASSSLGFRLTDCVDHFQENKNKVSTTVREAVETYLETIDDKSYRDVTIKQVRLQLDQLAMELGSTPCREVTCTMMEQWFAKRKWKRTTIDGVIGKVGPFFTWCIREGYSDYNPCKEARRPKADPSPPRIFSPFEAGELLQRAFIDDNGLVPYIAIGLFAGIRPMEIQRLSWRDVSGQYIEVTANKSKTRQRRLVEVLPNLSEWLQLGGELPAKNKRKRLTSLVAKCGLEWHPDIMRHSFASYHLAMFQSAEKTALELGHRDSTMLFRHYRELVVKDEAKEFWNLKPKLNEKM